MSVLDRASFRLTCKHWRSAAVGTTARVHLLQTACWQASAQQLRQVCPAATIVVNVDEGADTEQLVHSKLCDMISLAPQPELMTQWGLTTSKEYLFEIISNSSQQMLLLLRQAQRQLQGCNNVKHMEILLRIKSDQTGLGKMQNMISILSPAICHLRVMGSLLECARNMFPLANLHTLGFMLPYRFDQLQALQAAIISLPSLRTLHVYTHTANATSLLARLLLVLPRLNQLKTLRVVTSGHAICLPARNLLHITSLELGEHVIVNSLPDRLAHLCLEAVHHDYQAGIMMLQQMASTMHSLTVHAFTHEALLQLPCHLQVLTLSHLLDYSQLEEIGAALTRLSGLRVLRLHDFLIDSVVGMLCRLQLPNLQVLGFYMHPVHSYKSVHEMNHVIRQEASNTYMYVPSADSVAMALAFPVLQHFEVFCVSAKRFAIATLHCGFMNSSHFLSLHGVTFHCARFDVHLTAVPASCHVVMKSFAVH